MQSLTPWSPPVFSEAFGATEEALPGGARPADDCGACTEGGGCAPAGPPGVVRREGGKRSTFAPEGVLFVLGVRQIVEAPQILAALSPLQAVDFMARHRFVAFVALGAVTPGSRRRPDGVVLSWRYTDPNTVVANGLIPFFIDWGTSPHPALTAARGASLVQLRAEHPDAVMVQKMIDQLGLELKVSTAVAPAIIATIDSPRGRVELR